MSKGISEFIIFITGFVVGLPPHVLDPHYALSDVCMYVCMYVYVYIYIHTYIHIADSWAAGPRAPARGLRTPSGCARAWWDETTAQVLFWQLSTIVNKMNNLNNLKQEHKIIAGAEPGSQAAQGQGTLSLSLSPSLSLSLWSIDSSVGRITLLPPERLEFDPGLGHNWVGYEQVFTSKSAEESQTRNPTGLPNSAAPVQE